MRCGKATASASAEANATLFGKTIKESLFYSFTVRKSPEAIVAPTTDAATTHFIRLAIGA